MIDTILLVVLVLLCFYITYTMTRKKAYTITMRGMRSASSLAPIMKNALENLDWCKEGDLIEWVDSTTGLNYTMVRYGQSVYMDFENGSGRL